MTDTITLKFIELKTPLLKSLENFKKVDLDSLQLFKINFYKEIDKLEADLNQFIKGEYPVVDFLLVKNGNGCTAEENLKNFQAQNLQQKLCTEFRNVVSEKFRELEVDLA